METSYELARIKADTYESHPKPYKLSGDAAEIYNDIFTSVNDINDGNKVFSCLKNEILWQRSDNELGLLGYIPKPAVEKLVNLVSKKGLLNENEIKKMAMKSRCNRVVDKYNNPSLMINQDEDSEDDIRSPSHKKKRQRVSQNKMIYTRRPVKRSKDSFSDP